MYDSFTKFLSHFNGANGATVLTAETGQIITFAGTAQLSTAQKKFGSASLLLDGDSDYVTVPDSADWAFAANPFTIDGWFYTTNNAKTYMQIWSQGNNSTNYMQFYYASGAISFTIYESGYTIDFNCTATIANSTWTHIALVRVNTDNAATAWRIFVDGVSKTLSLTHGAWNATLPNFTGLLCIGSQDTEVTDMYWIGNIDEFRVSDSARWVNNFLPPTREYGKSFKGGVIIL